MSDRPHLAVVSSRPGAVARRILFERAHPEVAILVPAGLNVRWRAIVPPGKIPGRPGETTIGSYDLGDLMDQLDECYPPDGAAILAGARRPGVSPDRQDRHARPCRARAGTRRAVSW